ncbi:TPA: HamA C-terminal domain-containing protein [Bacillus anthracis]|uniref:HamA C-terminal domain-containing protein n=1 Tax=Bacillus anthracis TaxID=1392 RepID=UPI0033129527|nr:DUF1837 domain-containing protein [Bacillus cereus biovar anthracis]HDR6253806.1 DUF1837 domain-containing protein [Bacillus cereus biovar anthracis]
MKALTRRIKNLIFKFNVSPEKISTEKHPFTLNYEDGKYRQLELVRIIKDSVIHFALTADEIKNLKKTDDFGEMERKAWSRISKAHKNSKGDYGELLLFLMLTVFFPTKKFVTKVRLRSSTKDQIKGFDCAHFTVDDDDISLWLGEAKFHNNFSNAINGAMGSIEEHCGFDYLNDEISILSSNIEMNENFPHYEVLDNLLNGGISLDTIKIKIPVLLTFDSALLKKHSDLKDLDFVKNMEKEFLRKFKAIDEKKRVLKPSIEVLFLIIPFQSVKEIKDRLEMLEEVLLR